MPKDKKILETVHRHLEMPSTVWSLGTFGAVAEFSRHRDERCQIDLSPTGGAVTTERGGIGIDLKPFVTVAPYQMLRRDRLSWMWGVNFCATKENSALSKRKTITETGPDDKALSPEGRSGVLFDLGLGLGHIECCVRSNDTRFIDYMRSISGQVFSDHDSEIVEKTTRYNPARIFISRFGRIEATSPVPFNDEKTPPGPGVHIFPELLGRGRDHSANISVPCGQSVLLTMYPENPVADFSGVAKPFDRAAYDEFQSLIGEFTSPDDKKLIDTVIRAVRNAAPPRISGLTRSQRTLMRVVLRQLYWLDGANDSLARWQDAFEPGADLHKMYEPEP